MKKKENLFTGNFRYFSLFVWFEVSIYMNESLQKILYHMILTLSYTAYCKTLKNTSGKVGSSTRINNI